VTGLDDVKELAFMMDKLEEVEAAGIELLLDKASYKQQTKTKK
jgi:hypothetical protein